MWPGYVNFLEAKIDAFRKTGPGGPCRRRPVVFLPDQKLWRSPSTVPLAVAPGATVTLLMAKS